MKIKELKETASRVIASNGKAIFVAVTGETKTVYNYNDALLVIKLAKKGVIEEICEIK